MENDTERAELNREAAKVKFLAKAITDAVQSIVPEGYYFLCLLLDPERKGHSFIGNITTLKDQRRYLIEFLGALEGASEQGFPVILDNEPHGTA